jgi:hypothetical protein
VLDLSELTAEQFWVAMVRALARFYWIIGHDTPTMLTLCAGSLCALHNAGIASQWPGLLSAQTS